MPPTRSLLPLALALALLHGCTGGQPTDPPEVATSDGDDWRAGATVEWVVGESFEDGLSLLRPGDVVGTGTITEVITRPVWNSPDGQQWTYDPDVHVATQPSQRQEFHVAVDDVVYGDLTEDTVALTRLVHDGFEPLTENHVGRRIFFTAVPFREATSDGSALELRVVGVTMTYLEDEHGFARLYSPDLRATFSEIGPSASAPDRMPSLEELVERSRAALS